METSGDGEGGEGEAERVLLRMLGRGDLLLPALVPAAWESSYRQPRWYAASCRASAAACGESVRYGKEAEATCPEEGRERERFVGEADEDDEGEDNGEGEGEAEAARRTQLNK